MSQQEADMTEEEVCARAGEAAMRAWVDRCADTEQLMDHFQSVFGVQSLDAEAVIEADPRDSIGREWVIARAFAEAAGNVPLVEDHDGDVFDALDAAWNEYDAATIDASDLVDDTADVDEELDDADADVDVEPEEPIETADTGDEVAESVADDLLAEAQETIEGVDVDAP